MQRGLYMLPANGMIQEDRYISAGGGWRNRRLFDLTGAVL